MGCESGGVEINSAKGRKLVERKAVNVVKTGLLVCEMCGSELPDEWNFVESCFSEK